MAMRLIAALASTEALAEVFSCRNVLRSMLEFESALARAESRLGAIPADAAAQVATAAKQLAETVDPAELARKGQRAGTLAIPLVQALAAQSNGFAHWGATSQDVIDTAMALLLRQAHAILAKDHSRLSAALRRLSDAHATTAMPARTLLQSAPPTTFGLKSAGWRASLNRAWKRLDASFETSACLQFGGASGTLAALGNRGADIAAELAKELQLRDPGAPWHTQRENLAALVADLAVYCGALGKMALDIALLMQAEVGESAEPGGGGRGGSSAMPHKRNPTACMLAIAAARQTPGHAANFLNAMLQEHERAAGGWQSEWTAIEGAVQCVGVALESMVEAAEGLTVNPAKMRANIPDAVFAEKAMMQLAAVHGREKARQMVEQSLRDTGAPPPIDGLLDPETYLGNAELFRRRLLDEE